jgi:hypothetical protein
MKPDDVYEWLKKRYKGNMKEFEDLAKDLAKTGHKSARTGRPLNAGGLRAFYYNYNKPRASQDIKAQVKAAKAILGLKGDADSKLQMISQLLDQIDD